MAQIALGLPHDGAVVTGYTAGRPCGESNPTSWCVVAKPTSGKAIQHKPAPVHPNEERQLSWCQDRRRKPNRRVLPGPHIDDQQELPGCDPAKRTDDFDKAP